MIGGRRGVGEVGGGLFFSRRAASNSGAAPQATAIMRERPLCDMRPAPVCVEAAVVRHDALSAPVVKAFPCLPTKSSAARKAHLDHLDMIAHACDKKSFSHNNRTRTHAAFCALCRATCENIIVFFRGHVCPD